MDYINFATGLAQKAGEIMKSNFLLGMSKEWKQDGTPLTATDLEINQLVMDTVKEKYKGHGVLSEEGSDFSNDDEFVWVCDPLDGTIPFSHGIPTFVFSLALVQNGKSIVGVIYDPFMDRMFRAEKGKGAFLNGKIISVSKSSSFDRTLIGICLFKNRNFNFVKLPEKFSDKKIKTIDLRSITYMGALVACGELVGTIFAGIKPHDTAALKIIVEEAGGRVTDVFGNEQRYDMDIKGHIASNGILHSELVEMIKESVLV